MRRAALALLLLACVADVSRAKPKPPKPSKRTPIGDVTTVSKDDRGVTLGCMFGDMIAGARTRLHAVDEDGAGRCPSCTARMRLSRQQGLTIETCGDHGIWFENQQPQEVPPRVPLG